MAGAGLNVAVMPAAGFSSASVIGPLKFVRLSWMSTFPDAPAAIVRVAGETTSEKSDGAVTASWNDAVAVVTPCADAVTVTVALARAAVAAAVRSMREVTALPVSSAGAIVAVTPAGSPEIDTVTAPVKPPARASVTVTKVLDPGWIDAVAGPTTIVIEPVLPVGPSSPSRAVARQAKNRDPCREPSATRSLNRRHDSPASRE